MSTIEPWIRAFGARRTHAVADVPWLVRMREAAMQRFADAGWPSLREEGWRHTALHTVAEATSQWLADGGHDAFVPTQLSSGVLAQAQALLEPLRRTDTTGHWLVFVDGVSVPQLSHVGTLPDGVRLVALDDVLQADPAAVEPYYGHAAQGAPVMALNAAFARTGAFLELAAGVKLDAPVHLVFIAITPGRMRFLRNVIALGAGATATVVEHFIGVDAAAGLTHTATRAALARDAHFTHMKLQQEGLQTFHLGSTVLAQAQGAQHQSHCISLGARLARHDIDTCFNGQHGRVLLNGLYLLDGKRHVDHHTLIDHAHPDNISQQHYRGILADQARGVFCGRVLVAPGADRTDAQQRCDSLLLSRLARADTQPELEIYADDVKCAHGATVGKLDEDSLFYLRARGLQADQAHNILVYAFARQTLARIASPTLRAHASQAVRARLPGDELLGDFAWD